MKHFMRYSCWLFILSSSIMFAQVPRILNYQGVLADAAGVIVTDGDYSLTFRIYQVPTSGSAIWEEINTVTVKNGIFNTTLGSDVPLDIEFNDQYWLGITIGNGTELTPRIVLTSSAYSLNSSNSEKVNGIEANTTPTANNLLPLDNTGKFPKSIVPKIGMDGIQGTSSVLIDTTLYIQILALPINVSGNKDVFLTAHVAAEVIGSIASKRFEFSIRKGAVNGDMLTRGWWRVNTNIDGMVAETITFSAVDKNAAGNQTYYLVGRKFDTGPVNASVFISSLNAIYIEH